jgi:hypothetical protein
VFPRDFWRRGHHDGGGNHLLEGSCIRLEGGGGSKTIGMGNGSTGILGDMSHVDGSCVGDHRVNILLGGL